MEGMSSQEGARIRVGPWIKMNKGIKKKNTGIMGRSAGWSNTACEEAENWKFCESERAQKRLRMEGCCEKSGNGDKRKKPGG